MATTRKARRDLAKQKGRVRRSALARYRKTDAGLTSAVLERGGAQLWDDGMAELVGVNPMTLATNSPMMKYGRNIDPETGEIIAEPYPGMNKVERVADKVLTIPFGNSLHQLPGLALTRGRELLDTALHLARTSRRPRLSRMANNAEARLFEQAQRRHMRKWQKTQARKAAAR